MKARIMFVCHGNICRSPMAEFIMKKLVCDLGLSDDFVIESSATSTEEIWNGIGSPFYSSAKAELRRHKIPFSERRATLLTKADYERYDLFIGMDNANLRGMHRIFGSDPKGKVKKLMEYTGTNADVSDPWYSGDFEEAYRDIYSGCELLLKHIMKKDNYAY